jgi:hypothetical protein
MLACICAHTRSKDIYTLTMCTVDASTVADFLPDFLSGFSPCCCIGKSLKKIRLGKFGAIRYRVLLR